MFDIGWSELLLIGVVALIVVGPKDLPHLFHALGRFTAKARSMAREFSAAMDDAARESGINDAAKSLNDLKSVTSRKSLGLDALDRAADRFEKWDPTIPGRGEAAKPDPAAPGPSVAAPRAETSGPNADPARSEAGSPAAATPKPVSAPHPALLADADVAGQAAARPVASDDAAPQPDRARPSAGRPATHRRLRAVRRSDMKDL